MIIMYMTFLVLVSRNSGCVPLYATQDQKSHMICFEKILKSLTMSDSDFKFGRGKIIVD